MSSGTTATRKMGKLLDITTAAEFAGYSLRDFRKVIEEDRIPVLRIGRKYFVSARTLEGWKETRGEARFDAALRQLDGWVNQVPPRQAATVDYSELDREF